MEVCGLLAVIEAEEAYQHVIGIDKSATRKRHTGAIFKALR
jgi:hypothetical protein